MPTTCIDNDTQHDIEETALPNELHVQLNGFVCLCSVFRMKRKCDAQHRTTWSFRVARGQGNVYLVAYKGHLALQWSHTQTAVRVHQALKTKL